MPHFNRISIVCPSLNNAKALLALIESVLSQTCTNYELIIIDGGSTDETLQLLHSYYNVANIHFISEPDRGIYDAMNKGIELASGEWICFMGADDSLYDAHSLEHLQPHLAEGRDVVMCDVDVEGRGPQSSFFSKKTFYKNTVHHQGVVYRKSVFETRRYDASFRIMGDYEFNLYLWTHRFTITAAPILLARHSLDGVSARARWCNYREEIKARNRYLSNPFARVYYAFASMCKYVVKRIKRAI